MTWHVTTDSTIHLLCAPIQFTQAVLSSTATPTSILIASMSSISCITPLTHIRMHTSCDLCGDGMTANEKFVVCKSLLT